MRLKHKIIVLPCVSVGLLMAMVAIMLIRQYAQSQQGMTVTLVLNRLLWQTTLMGGVILIITLFLAWGLAHKHLTPIVKITVIAREIAGGDLSSAANAMKTLAKHESIELQSASDDETGQLLLAFETMTENLNSLVGQVQRSGVQVSSSSSELFASARQQEAMVTNQMESMTKVRTSVEEISTIAADLVQTIHRVAAISQETADFASSGQTDLVRLKDAMYRMEKASKAISDKLGAINEKADNITAVITTIAKVADQTNLLSLNAAIEAEKAGEYGHGFME